MPTDSNTQSHNHAWNPGIETEIPEALRRLETIYRDEHVITRYEEIPELMQRTGLPAEELVTFRPERLALHELIVRVTADIVVREGEEEEALGINFRAIVHTLLNNYIEPLLPELQASHRKLKLDTTTQVNAILSETLFAPAETAVKPTLLQRLFGQKTKPARSLTPALSTQEKEHLLINGYKEKGLAAETSQERAIYKSLYRVFGTLASTHGYVGTDRQLLSELVIRHVCNNYGSRMIGQRIGQCVEQAISQEGYARTHKAEAPLLISLKGASAAGKSSLRPMLKQIMAYQGIGENDYATISPDIWRRLLLDYDSLGDQYKYAGRLTSNEVSIIDSKLDRYIRNKATEQRSIPNLLIDRFRFDSFTSEKISMILHDTYAKYVDTMYMYFVVTPPEATVERGWLRGLERGRYKSVEDFLGHSIEAYTGMPKLLFKWLAYKKPKFNYHFLDNSVPKGTPPATIAWGDQQEMHIFDPVSFINIERYRKINVHAKTPEAVYPAGEKMAVEHNCRFLQQCIKEIPRINFIDPATLQPYLISEQGQIRLINRSLFDFQLRYQEQKEVFELLAPHLIPDTKV